jgi:hypothetical protein
MCSCGPPEGSRCSSLVSVYDDSTCSNQIGSVLAQSSAPICLNIPAGHPLGSKTASPPVYEPGKCPASGGELTGLPVPDAQTTLCCLPQQEP